MHPGELIKTALENYGLGTLQSYARLKHGFANESYKIVTGKGVYLFRVHLQQSMESVEKEHNMLAALKEEHFPAAFPVADSKGNTVQFMDNHPVSIYDFMEGQIPELNPKTVAEIARVLARLHTTDLSRVPEKVNSIRPEKVANLIRKFSEAINPIPDIFQQFTCLWNQMEPALHQELPTGLVHGDVFPDNTLFQGNKLKAIIDFEQFSIDQLLFDVAMCMNGFCFLNNRPDTFLLEIFLDAYNQKRPMENIEKELLPLYIRWTALGMVSWHLNYHLMFRADARQEKRVRELLDRVEYLRF